MQETAPVPDSKPVLFSLWAYLFNYESRTEDVTIRAKARLLNRMLVVIFASLVVVSTINVYRDFSVPDTFFLIEYAGLGTFLFATLASFLVNRFGHYNTAARLLVVSGFTGTIILSSGLLVGLLYFSTIVILAAIYLSQDETILTAIGALGFTLLYGVLQIQTEASATIFVPLYFFIATLPLLIIYMLHTRGLEEQRRAILEEANRKLRESERILEQRVQERTAELETARQEAVTARDHALEADRVKSQFLASMSHELRTPLNSILTFSELMAMGTFGDVTEEQEDYLNKMLFSGKHLLSLINDVLDITKIHAGMMKLFLEDDFDVSQEAALLAETAANMLGNKPVELVTDIDPHIPLVTCDKRRIRQVILNLLSNAVKFTEQGTITLSVKSRPDHLLVMISDTGPGIAAEQQAIVFEPFIQTEQGIKHAGGTGLGLPISKRLIEEHGGQLWLESAPGEGATFFFTLTTNITVSSEEKDVVDA